MRDSSKRNGFILTACRQWVRKHAPEVEQRIVDEANKKYPLVRERPKTVKHDYSFLDDMTLDI